MARYPILMVFVMGCGLISGVQGLQNAATTALPALQTAASTDLPAMETAASTEIPALLTSVPTAQGAIETAAAQPSTSTCAGTPTPGDWVSRWILPGRPSDVAAVCVCRWNCQWSAGRDRHINHVRSLDFSGHCAGIFRPVYWGCVQFEPDFGHHPSHGPAGYRRSGRQRIEYCSHRHITRGCTIVFSYLGGAKLFDTYPCQANSRPPSRLSSLPCKGTRPAWYWILSRRNRAYKDLRVPGNSEVSFYVFHRSLRKSETWCSKCCP